MTRVRPLSDDRFDSAKTSAKSSRFGQRRIEQVDRVLGRGRSVGRRSGGEIDARLEDPFAAPSP